MKGVTEERSAGPGTFQFALGQIAHVNRISNESLRHTIAATIRSETTCHHHQRENQH